jgi:DNA polymerase-2
MRLFKKEPIEPFIKSYIKKIKEGKLDEKLIYRKSIRKAVEEYTKTTPPHVKAARLLDKIESNIIEYYITKAGPEPIQKLKHKIDYEHYIEKQIAPIANQILILLGKSVEEIEKGSKQSKLF